MLLNNEAATLPTPPPGITVVNGRHRTQILMPLSLARWYRNALWFAFPALMAQIPITVGLLLTLVIRDTIDRPLIAISLAIATLPPTPSHPRPIRPRLLLRHHQRPKSPPKAFAPR